MAVAIQDIDAFAFADPKDMQGVVSLPIFEGEQGPAALFGWQIKAMHAF
jgi:hypothetical protein